MRSGYSALREKEKHPCHHEVPNTPRVILVRDGGECLRLGGALDPSAVSGDPPETSEARRFAESAPGRCARRVCHRASSRCFRRVAESGTRVECSTRSCTAASGHFRDATSLATERRAGGGGKQRGVLGAAPPRMT